MITISHITVPGCSGNWKVWENMTKDGCWMLGCLQELDLELEKFITHQVSFSDINKAFDYMLKGQSLRCIIKMDA